MPEGLPTGVDQKSGPGTTSTSSATTPNSSAGPTALAARAADDGTHRALDLHHDLQLGGERGRGRRERQDEPRDRPLGLRQDVPAEVPTPQRMCRPEHTRACGSQFSKGAGENSPVEREARHRGHGHE